MSQPSLYHSSLSGLEGTRFSFSSLSEEDKPSLMSDRSVVSETPQSTPRARKMSNRLEFTLRTSVIGKRERLSQPTLLVGDTHPKAHQRLSQPTLGYASREYPACLQSPLFKKKRSSQTSNIYLSPKSPIAITKRDKMSQLDVGAARYTFFQTKFSSSFLIFLHFILILQVPTSEEQIQPRQILHPRARNSKRPETDSWYTETEIQFGQSTESKNRKVEEQTTAHRQFS